MKSRQPSRKDQRLREAIQQHRQQQARRLYQVEHLQLAAILDGLNAFGLLESIQKRPPASLLCYGPADQRGSGPIPWVSVVVWYRPVGPHQYQTLWLLGVWAHQMDDGTQITVGTRTLRYSAPFYNPESYFYQIRRDFSMYYEGEAGPPEGSSQLMGHRYDASQRLAMRREVEAALERWRES